MGAFAGGGKRDLHALEDQIESISNPVYQVYILFY